ncbi:hypothetical protein [Rhizobium sp. Root1203]|uniref:hypothetical protein n=1 Tax=Rhizobium sp. Root1203 TaxID=1736427 RepID=UPI000ACC05BF|nr:hypothetical protein [Rhizobium sp. Root1203]
MTVAVRLTEIPIFAHCGTNMRVDIGDPNPRAVNFRLLAAALSKQARFDGRHEGGFAFSAAQHAVQGAQAILNETRDQVMAGLFLLRDGHQWLLGERSKPFQILLAMKAGIDLTRVDDEIKSAWDEAIYAAAGMLPPSRWTKRLRETIEAMDDRMARAEAISLFGPKAAADFPNLTQPKLTGALHPWGPGKAETAWIELFMRLSGRTHLN